MGGGGGRWVRGRGGGGCGDGGLDQRAQTKEMAGDHVFELRK